MSYRVLLRPSAWIIHLVALVLVTAAVLLGVWQVGSWQEQRSDEATNRQQLDPVPLADALGPDEPFPQAQVGRRVTVAGTWVPESTVYVSDRPHGDQVGYWAMTPLAVGSDAGAPALLVVRGWTTDPAAAPEPPSGETEVTAWLQPPEGSAGVSDSDRTDDVIPQVRMADAVQHVDQDLYGAYAVLDPDAETLNAGVDGLRPADLEQLPEVAATTGLRNLLYGVEWWIFAAFAAFIWWRWCADAVAEARAETDAEAGSDALSTTGSLGA